MVRVRVKTAAEGGRFKDTWLVCHFITPIMVALLELCHQYLRNEIFYCQGISSLTEQSYRID
jgi:hypothetical protein